MQIVAISDGSSLGPHEMGEMCLKCEFFMTAYLGNPEATEEAIDANGWLHTGKKSGGGVNQFITT